MCRPCHHTHERQSRRNSIRSKGGNRRAHDAIYRMPLNAGLSCSCEHEGERSNRGGRHPKPLSTATKHPRHARSLASTLLFMLLRQCNSSSKLVRPVATLFESICSAIVQLVHGTYTPCAVGSSGPGGPCVLSTQPVDCEGTDARIVGLGIGSAGDNVGQVPPAREPRLGHEALPRACRMAGAL